MKRTAALALGLALALTGCSSTSRPPTPAELDQVFLSAVKQDPPPADDAALIRTAHVICDLYAEHPDPTTWVTIVKTLVDKGFTPYQAGETIGASTGAYCPKYSGIRPK